MGTQKSQLKFFILALSITSSPLFSDEKGIITVLPNLTNVSFDNQSDKISANSKGVYAAYISDKDTFAVSAEKTTIKTNVFGAENVEQSNFSFGINGIDEEGWNTGITAHFISSPDDYIWSGFIVNGKVGMFYGYDSYTGVQLSYSSYTPPASNIFQVYQLGFFQEWYWKNFSFSLNPKGILVSGMGGVDEISEQVGGAYFSLTATPTIHFGSFSLGASYTAGQERFAVKNNGFIVNNSPDLYTEQSSLFSGLKLGDLYLKGTVGQSELKTYGGNNEGQSQFTSFSVNFSF